MPEDAAHASEGEASLKHPSAPTSPAISAGDLMTRLYAFADDSMQGREAGTEGSVRATRYLAAETRRIGLQPGGENGSFFQTVPMVNRAVDSSSSLDVGGAQFRLDQDFIPIPLVPILPYGWQIQAKSAPAFYAGRVGDSLTPAILAQSAGKFVVFGPALDEAGKPTPLLFIHGPPAPLPGAAAVAFATLEIIPEETRDFLHQPHPVLTTTIEKKRRIPLSLLISSAIAEKAFGGSFASLKPGTVGKPIEGHIKSTATPPAAPARNVVAILPGSDARLRGEYVALGAHNDHIGIRRGPGAIDHDSLRLFNAMARPEGEEKPAKPVTTAQLATIQWELDSVRRLRPPRSDSIFNGADDDGSGSVTLLEIAEAFARGKDRPKRSMLFVWHGAEEKGLFGSEWFTDHPTVPRDSIVAQLNLDMIGRGSASDVQGGGPNALDLVGSRRLSTELGGLIEQINRRRRAAFKIDYRYDARGDPTNLYCRADHFMYARFGIPIAYFTTGFHRDFHQVTDEPQYIDYDHMARVAGLVRDVALSLADLDHRLVVDQPKPDPNAPCRQ